MYKILRADKDTYITDRVIKGTRVVTSNVGSAGSLDLFKLYGATTSGSLFTPNTELSRLLVHYDLQPLRDLVSAKKLDPGNPSFNCTLKLFDVYGGQPTPANFTVNVHPLSKSFDEGLGRDVVYYADHDVCNFLTSSRAQGQWILSGCAQGGGVSGTICDYLTASTFIANTSSLKSAQFFTTGEENLEVDVTLVVSATLAGLLPDAGFRISLDDALEIDLHTYFVKRFASRTAFNEDKRPRLIVKYDDSVQDDSQLLFLDSPSTLFLYNYIKQSPASLTSGSALTQITGSNSLLLTMMTEISGVSHASSSFTFSGSQHTIGIFPVTGVYSASVTIPSTNQYVITKLAQSSSITFTPIWGSLDGTVGFLTGSKITVFPPQRGAITIDNQRLVITVHGISDVMFTDEARVLKVHLFDSSSPLIKAARLPVELPGIVTRDVHYQIRDDVTGIIEIPFDTVKNSTRLSSDASGMFFKLDASNLTHDRSYIIDILVVTSTNRQVYKSASPTFRVSDTR